MNLDEIQQSVDNFVSINQIQTDLKSRMLDLFSELGEVSKEILKSTDYGKKDFIPTDNWENEIGDAFFSLICIANQTNIKLAAALNKVLGKYDHRLMKKGHIGSAK